MNPVALAITKPGVVINVHNKTLDNADAALTLLNSVIIFAD